MYAVVDIKGFQYKLQKGDTLKVPKFDLQVGENLTLQEVLLISDGDNISIGTPYVEGALVEATVTGQGKDKKIIVFKKKRRKDYAVKRGHRQEFTEIEIQNIKISSEKTSEEVAEKSAEQHDFVEVEASE